MRYIVESKLSRTLSGTPFIDYFVRDTQTRNIKAWNSNREYCEVESERLNKEHRADIDALSKEWIQLEIFADDFLNGEYGRIKALEKILDMLTADFNAIQNDPTLSLEQVQSLKAYLAKEAIQRYEVIKR